MHTHGIRQVVSELNFVYHEFLNEINKIMYIYVYICGRPGGSFSPPGLRLSDLKTPSPYRGGSFKCFPNSNVSGIQMSGIHKFTVLDLNITCNILSLCNIKIVIQLLGFTTHSCSKMRSAPLRSKQLIFNGLKSSPQHFKFLTFLNQFLTQSQLIAVSQTFGSLLLFLHILPTGHLS